jgi:uncharacterized Rossmann fold enzyme
MDFKEWEPHYIEILKEFGYSRETDERAARILDETLAGARIEPRVLERMLKSQEVSVAGNGPSLKDEIARQKGLLITADEASSVAMQAGFGPDIIVTDLDGEVKDQIKANVRGAIVVIHAHGDNIPAIRRWAPLFRGRVMATTQSRPFSRVYDFGGFTDGDRAVFLANHFAASNIHLLGFDFEHPSPKDENPEVKLRKLAWAKRLISSLGIL